jgi:hypothetical protein
MWLGFWRPSATRATTGACDTEQCKEDDDEEFVQVSRSNTLRNIPDFCASAAYYFHCSCCSSVPSFFFSFFLPALPGSPPHPSLPPSEWDPRQSPRTTKRRPLHCCPLAPLQTPNEPPLQECERRERTIKNGGGRERKETPGETKKAEKCPEPRSKAYFSPCFSASP